MVLAYFWSLHLGPERVKHICTRVGAGVTAHTDVTNQINLPHAVNGRQLEPNGKDAT